MKWVNKGELAVGRRREDAAAGGYMRHKSFSLELLAIISPCSTCWVAPLTFLLSVLGQGFCSFGVFGYYSDVYIKNIDILPNRQYIANTADSAQEQYS